MRIEQKAVSGSAQFSFQHSKIYINLVGKYFATENRRFAWFNPSDSPIYKTAEQFAMQ
jgi:hypothetical protein